MESKDALVTNGGDDLGIAQGATPYLMITIEGFDLTDARAIKVTIKTPDRMINLDKDRVTVASDNNESLLVVHLTQEETLSLSPCAASVQIRWRDANNESHTTKMTQMYIYNALYKGVI